jgi:hypothetical protein
MSAIGTKRTSACALHMSAFDPKQTSTAPGLQLLAARFRRGGWRPMGTSLRRLGMSGGTMSARKNRPHARINLLRTHNVPAMKLAKNANTEPKDTTYNKNFIRSPQMSASVIVRAALVWLARRQLARGWPRLSCCLPTPDKRPNRCVNLCV